MPKPIYRFQKFPEYGNESNNITNTEGNKNHFTTSYDFTQIVFDPSHILPISSSCIDLTFQNQTNLVISRVGSTHPCNHTATIKLFPAKKRVPPILWALNLRLQKYQCSTDQPNDSKDLIGRNHLRVKMFMIKFIYSTEFFQHNIHNFIPKKPNALAKIRHRLMVNFWTRKMRQILNKKNEIIKQFIKNAKHNRLHCICGDLIESIRY